MKKLLLSIIAGMCMLGFTACGNADTSSSGPTETSKQTETALQETQAQQTEQSAELTEAAKPDEEKAVPEQTEEQSQNADTDKSKDADTIVVYFSATGTTKGVAERIAAVTGGDLFELLPAEPYSDADLRPSSTKIRNFLLQGNIAEANRLLGYDYQLTGRVVHGRMIGRQIGFPTANIMPATDKLIPAAGVYKVAISNQQSAISGQLALVNIGTNPTVGNTHQTIEVHIPGFEGDLYNQTLTLQFIERIRGEQRFASLDELQAQIRKDLSNL